MPSDTILTEQSITIANFLCLNNKEIRIIEKLFYSYSEKGYIPIGKLYDKKFITQNSIEAKLLRIFGQNLNYNQFFWFVISLSFFSFKLILQLTLAAYKLNPFETISQIKFANFFAEINVPLTPADIESYFVMCNPDSQDKESMTIDFEGILHIDSYYPHLFQHVRDMMTNMQNRVFGKRIIKNINDRKSNLPRILAFVRQNHQFPRESCIDSTKRIFTGDPPLYVYDYCDLTVTEATISTLVQKYCNLYCPSENLTVPDSPKLPKVKTRTNSGFKFNNKSIDKILSRAASRSSHHSRHSEAQPGPISFSGSYYSKHSNGKKSVCRTPNDK